VVSPAAGTVKRRFMLSRIVKEFKQSDTCNIY
jgi:hypothetical protein